MTLRAGAAVRDISPTTPMGLFGYPHVKRTSTGVHDPLLASALYLDNGSATLVLVALDILQLTPPDARNVRAAVAKSTGTPEASVFVSCSHTHSGPVTMTPLAWAEDPTLPPPDLAYVASIADRAAEAAAEAKATARAAELAWTTADARGAGGNRLSSDGLTDPEVGILAIRDKDASALMAAAMVYGMHPTVLHEDSTLISSDFPYYTRQCIRERLGDSLVLLYHTAPAGNQSPRYFVRGQTFEEAERLGRKVGNPIADSLAALAPEAFSDDIRLAGQLRTVSLPRRRLPSLEAAEKQLAEYRATYERLKAENAGHGPVRTAECAIFGAESTVALARAQEQGRTDQLLDSYEPTEVQAVRIGDGILAGLPGEVFVEYSLEIKQRAGTRLFVVSLVNGALQGYIVTPEAAAAGGYEATNGLFAPESGRALVEAALDMAKALA